MDEATLLDADGVEIFYRSWLPASPPQAIVLVLHGMSEHSGRYQRFGEALAAAGFAAYADDHRGFGRTATATATATGFGRAGPRGFDGVLEAIHAVQLQAIADVGPLPVIVFGHSMGSVFTQVYAQVHASELAGVVLCGSFGPDPQIDLMVGALQSAVDGGAGDVAMPTIGPFNEPFEPSRTPFDWLSRDEAEVDAYIADPLCGDGAPPTLGYALGVLQCLVRGTDTEQIANIPKGFPVLLITGTADPVSTGGATVRLLEALYRSAGLDVTAHYYEDARHELLNETNRDKVEGDVLQWLRGVISGDDRS